MIILDSDIIIYSALPARQHLRDFIRASVPLYSKISLIEVLGYHNLSDYDEKYFSEFFDSLTAVPISDEIISTSILLRQQRKINLGDSLIAATAMINDFSLLTNNKKDFEWIESLTLIDPIVESE